MVKLNSLQYQNTNTPTLDESYSVEPLKNNSEFEAITKSFKKKYLHNSLNTFSFTKEGFLSVFFQLQGSIAISLGECEAIVQAGKMYEKLGHEITWISLNSSGEIKYQMCKDLKVDFFFVSSYVMDTFIQTSLEKIKEYTKAKIISNCSANKYAKNADLILFDAYKLCGYGVCGVILYSSDELEKQYDGETDVLGLKLIYEALEKQKFVISNKDNFIEALKEEFKEDLHFFVDANLTLPYTLHFGLKDIKARQIIRTLSLHDIYVTNGEGCSLGLARPSRIIQAMGYEEEKSRWALSFTFDKEYTSNDIQTIIKTMGQKYRQIKALS